MFDKDTHGYLGSFLCDKEADAILVDLDILIEQPCRLFWAGVIDATAKKIEIEHYMRDTKENLPLGVDMAYAVAKETYDFYIENHTALINALETKTITKAFETAVFYSIAVTGIVSGLSKGAKQTALAHCFYEQARTCFYAECKEALHGEMVGVGLILQLKYNGLDNESMLKRLRALGMPTAFSDIHIPPTAQNAVLFAEKLCIPKITSDPMKTKEEVLNAMTAICK